MAPPNLIYSNVTLIELNKMCYPNEHRLFNDKSLSPTNILWLYKSCTQLLSKSINTGCH